MQVDLQVIHYQIMKHLSTPPHMVDWDFLGVSKDARNEITNWSYGVKESTIEDSVVIEVSSDINVPAVFVHSGSGPAGMYYRYDGTSEFLLHKKDATDLMIAELALCHLSKFPPLIAYDTHEKTGGKYVHSTNIPCLANLLLTVEAFKD